ncbi:hypothetical protein MKZ38_002821 [Zalerion maritima]|uniref:ATPase inhibitor, mitochondrial n=1 Tax=Zalerion maritima TaxID=339359 RepID=A0AAD5RP37_9PEZI|nr:hypothetical protein MKZ38_002821 [Zalerion maritima]
MFRQSVTKIARRPATMTPAAYTRTFGTTAKTCSEGDTGAPPKTGGTGDAFQRREHALEEMAIRQREHEKLVALKKKIDQQQEHLKQLSDHIDEIVTNQGGEKN